METRVLMPVNPCYAGRHQVLGHGPKSLVGAHQHPSSLQAARCTGDTLRQRLGSGYPAFWSNCHTCPWRTLHSTVSTNILFRHENMICSNYNRINFSFQKCMKTHSSLLRVPSLDWLGLNPQCCCEQQLRRLILNPKCLTSWWKLT